MAEIVGSIKIWSGMAHYIPKNWKLCDGEIMSASEYPDLFTVIGKTYGGSTGTFQLPDYRSRVAMGSSASIPIGTQGGKEYVYLTNNNLPSHSHSFNVSTSQANNASPNNNVPASPMYLGGDVNSYISSVPNTSLATDSIIDSGGREPHNNMQVYTSLYYIICCKGVLPKVINEDVLGMVNLFATNSPPTNWLPCDGAILKIADYKLLYSLIGSQFGGDNVTTFALPQLQNNVAASPNLTAAPGGGRAGIPNFIQGTSVGSATETLTVEEIPVHSHGTWATPKQAQSNLPTSGSYIAGIGEVSAGVFVAGEGFVNAPNEQLAQTTIGNDGGNEGHENRQPFLSSQFYICYKGNYPSRN